MGKTPDHIKERNRLWRERNPDYMRAYSARRRQQPGWKREKHLLHRYGLTLDEWWDLYRRQSGMCLVCVVRLPSSVAVDHDHATGEVRGLLCFGCNAALGYLERPGWLASARAYLEIE